MNVFGYAIVELDYLGRSDRRSNHEGHDNHEGHEHLLVFVVFATFVCCVVLGYRVRFTRIRSITCTTP